MSDEDVLTPARLEFRRRVVESMFSASHSTSFLETLRSAGQESPTWAFLPQPEQEELFRRIRDIPEILATIGLKIKRL